MSKPQRGDVRKGGDDVLLLVLSVNEEEGYEWCNVMYLHNDVDMATVSRLNDGLCRLISTAPVT